MAFPLNEKDLDKEITQLLSHGLGGNASDFFHWVRMEIHKKFKDEPTLTLEQVTAVLDKYKASGGLLEGKFDAREYFLAEKSQFEKKAQSQDSYKILGALEFVPLQYVKSRLEYFLKRNGVSEEEIIDISIATIEAVENAVKYGDGEIVEVEYSIDRGGKFEIHLLNTIKEFDFEDDIRRGKFSSTATLMRGMMVMQKLFNHVDLEILEDRKQARFQANRQLSL